MSTLFIFVSTTASDLIHLVLHIHLIFGKLPLVVTILECYCYVSSCIVSMEARPSLTTNNVKFVSLALRLVVMLQLQGI